MDDLTKIRQSDDVNQGVELRTRSFVFRAFGDNAVSLFRVFCQPIVLASFGVVSLAYVGANEFAYLALQGV